MSHNPEKIILAARKMLPDLDEALQNKVRPLVERGEAGEQTHNQIVDLLTESSDVRMEFRRLLAGDQEILLRGFSGLGGKVSTSPGDVFVCPECDYTKMIAEAGENPGECPTHNIPLEPEDKKG